jgi:hypothetical protein
MLDRIGETAKRILQRAEQDGVATSIAADRIAEEIIAAAD